MRYLFLLHRTADALPEPGTAQAAGRPLGKRGRARLLDRVFGQPEISAASGGARSYLACAGA